jgi:hypothetical protein
MKTFTNATLCALLAALTMTGCEYNRPRQSQTSRHEIRNDRPSDNRYESNNRYSRSLFRLTPQALARFLALSWAV